MAVTTSSIVERFDVIGDVLRRCFSISVNSLPDAFLLETTEERFGDSVIPTVAPTTHARF